MSPWIAGVANEVSKSKPGADRWLPRPDETATSSLALTDELALSRPSNRRTRLWDLPDNFHCSVIGTCLPASETRRVLMRLGVKGVEECSEHETHRLAVLAARRPGDGAKFLHKALDQRYRAAIVRFSKYKTTAEIEGAWKDALGEGDIPGPYWAVLTHPLTTAQLIKQSFYDVHMLSHLAGAANRADIRRLRALEARTAELTEILERQQHRIRNGFVNRDNEIKELKAALARASVERQAVTAPPDVKAIPIDAAADVAALRKKWMKEVDCRKRLEAKLSEVALRQEEAESARRTAEERCSLLSAELAGVEERLESILERGEKVLPKKMNLAEQTLLYVGGRKHQIPALRALIDRFNGRFLHHDGGIDDSPTLLPGLISQSNIVVFPVDCVSHGAVAVIKRDTCLGKQFLPLRTSSLTCFISALSLYLTDASG